MKQEYAKLILSRKSKNLCTNIEKCKQQSTINDLVLLRLWAVCILFAYLYFEFPIERVKFLEYKSLANICISESLLYYYWRKHRLTLLGSTQWTGVC